MKPRYQALNGSFIVGPLSHCLRYLPPHERLELSYLAHSDHADVEGGHEPTIKISLRVAVSLAIRLDCERATVKRALRRRRATRSDAVRWLIEQHLALLDQQRAMRAPASQDQQRRPESEPDNAQAA